MSAAVNVSQADQQGSSPSDTNTNLSNKPDETSRFKQQRLPAWQPVMSPPWVISFFLIIGVIFISLGSVIVTQSDAVVEVVVRYDQVQACDFNDRLPAYGYACEPFVMPLQIPKTLKAPVFMYYSLENFYQNHRRYAKSRSDVQLADSDPDPSSMSDCAPFLHPGEFSDLGDVGVVYYDEDKSNSGGPAANPVDLSRAVYNPCGLIAWSKFNDSFALFKNETNGAQTLICDGANFNASGNQIDARPMQCVKKGIAWDSDPGVRYIEPSYYGPRTITSKGWPGACASGNSSQYNPYLCNGWYMGEVGHQIPSAIDEDLMVWSRLSSLSSFRKLYRKITTDLEAGSYSMQVRQRFDVRAFDGKKSFILATTNWLGGKNYFLGGLYICVGAICVVLAIAFISKHLTSRRSHVTV